MGKQMIKEISLSPFSGWLLLPIQLIAFPIILLCFVFSISKVDSNQVVGILGIIICVFLFLLWLFNWNGFFVVNPNESRVVLFFGRYRGSVRAVGFHYVNPFSSKKRLSLRIRTFETGAQSISEVKDPTSGRVVVAAKRGRGHPIKVNDLDGNPIEIAAVVVWRVTDTAEALFNVEAFDQYV